MAQAVNDMLQGVAMIGVATIVAVVFARVGIIRLFR
jgi:hypothetical protein